jgi:hypothetical protein
MATTTTQTSADIHALDREKQRSLQGWNFYRRLDNSDIEDMFQSDGFVCLSKVLPANCLREWIWFAGRHFEDTFTNLYENGHTSFPQHSHINNDGRIEYAMQLGVKNGFREVVMRSPGRYELSLLHLSPDKRPPMKPILDNLEFILPSILQETCWEDVQICHISLVVSTPGAVDQAWHSDGGHVDVTKHSPCHCANIFLPLIDVTDVALGPTELRPGTHHHSRDLARMMLLAKARKTLRAPATPLLKQGDALVFDYRILHRGRANTTLTTNRPMLVLTIAKKWFKDISNFPLRSLFEPPEHHEKNVGS